MAVSDKNVQGWKLFCRRRRGASAEHLVEKPMKAFPKAEGIVLQRKEFLCSE